MSSQAFNEAPTPHFPNGVTDLMQQGMNIREAMLVAAQHRDPVAIQTSMMLFAHSMIDREDRLPTGEEISIWAGELDIDLDVISPNHWKKIEEYLSQIKPRRQMAWMNGPLPGPKVE